MSTKVTNKQIAEVFIAAKNFLRGDYTGEKWQYRTPHICCAIDITKLSAANIKAAKGVIEKRLGRCNTVGEWLYVNGHVTGATFDANQEEARQIQLYRHRWLDSLIEEFSK